jgi:ankyrin repeat protein
VACANVPLAEALIKAGADVNTRTGPPAGSQHVLHYAMDQGRIHLFKMLLDAGADPNTKDNDGKKSISSRDLWVMIAQVFPSYFTR